MKPLVKFIIVGISNTILTTSTFALLTYLNTNNILAFFLSYSLGTVNSYTLNSRWTFGNTLKQRRF